MKLNKLIMGALAAAVIAPAANAALDTTFNAGDLILGFRANAGQGSSTTIMANLGAASIYRDTTVNLLNIGSLGSLLSTTYGSGWYDRTDLWTGFAAATNGTNVDNSGSVAVGQDPNSTIYTVVRRTATGTIGLASSTRPGNSIAIDAQTGGANIDTLGFTTFDNNDVNGIVNISSTLGANGTNWNDQVGGSTAADFGAVNVEAVFATGNRGAFGDAGTVEQLYDFYRIPQFVGGNAPGEAGKGSYEGTFTINNTGDVSFVVTAVPEPSTYAFLGLGILGLVTAIVRRKKTVNV